jgi:hypothetical protein
VDKTEGEDSKGVVDYSIDSGVDDRFTMTKKPLDE